MGQRLVKSRVRLGHINGDVIEWAVSSIFGWDLSVVIGLIGEGDERDE